MSVQLQLGASQAQLEGLGARLFVGRDPSACQLALLDPTLSRRHAELWLDDGALYLRDLGSANGTWVDGRQLGHEAVALRPGQQVWLGHVSLGVAWSADAGGGATVVSREAPAELKALIAARQAQQPVAAPPSQPPMPTEFAYRKQGANDNGVLLLALRQDTFFNGGGIDGYVEFTSLDNQTVASITVELVEHHRRASASGHVWDRVLVRQGPWRAKHGDIVPLPFTLRVPPGVAMSGRDCEWELRGNVDINWATDVKAAIPIAMRNQDIERLRDALGAMDYRVVDIASDPLGQHFDATFAPPALFAKDWGVNEVKLVIEYLGANLKLRMLVDRKGMHHDRALDQVFELTRFRAASQAEVSSTLAAMLGQLLPAK